MKRPRQGQLIHGWQPWKHSTGPLRDGHRAADARATQAYLYRLTKALNAIAASQKTIRQTQTP